MNNFFLKILIIAAFLSACKKGPTRMETSEALVSPFDFLSDYKFTGLTIDIVYDHGVSPSPRTIDYIKDMLNNRIRKPKGITVTMKEISASGKDKISLNDILETEQKNRTYYTSGKNLACFVYLANSDFSEDKGSTGTFGINYAPTSIVLFGKTMQCYAGGTGQPSYSTIEATVAGHEFGHLMGLVNKGSAMVKSHVDAPHGKHCNNPKCLTYYLMETSDVIASLSSGNIPVLDSNCIKDLRRNGGQ